MKTKLFYCMNHFIGKISVDNRDIIKIERFVVELLKCWAKYGIVKISEYFSVTPVSKDSIWGVQSRSLFDLAKRLKGIYRNIN